MQYPPLFRLQCYTHCFVVADILPHAEAVVREFSQRFVYKTLIKRPKIGWVLTPTKLFASKLNAGTLYHFHSHALDDFIAFLKDRHLHASLYTIETHALYTPTTVAMHLRPQWVARPYQEPIVKFLETLPPPRSRFVGIRTGRGKTFCALAAIATFQQRTVIIIKPAYLEKWCNDICTVLDVEPSRLMTVKGSGQLKGVIALAAVGELTADFILISNRTYQNYIEEYELSPYQFEDTGYDCTPLRFFETLGVGVLLVDEAHQEFYAGFKLQLHTHVPLLIALSATMLNDNPFLDKMYALVFPKADRYVEQETKNYIHATGVMYAFQNPERIRVSEYGNTFYSHSAFEKSILKQPRVLANYIAMIQHVAQIGFIKTYEPGDKLAVFATSIVMCTLLTDALQRAFPQLDVRRYVEKDPYENIIDADIRVTTILSGGTAHDIPGLTAVILSVNVLSSQSNIQTLGRLREIPGRAVRFYYLWCHQLPKHRAYHTRRIEMLRERTATIQQLAHSGAL